MAFAPTLCQRCADKAEAPQLLRLRVQVSPCPVQVVIGLKSRETLRKRTVELERRTPIWTERRMRRTVFLATMSHERRTPLNAILGFTHTLLMRMRGASNEA